MTRPVESMPGGTCAAPQAVLCSSLPAMAWAFPAQGCPALMYPSAMQLPAHQGMESCTVGFYVGTSSVEKKQVAAWVS